MNSTAQLTSCASERGNGRVHLLDGGKFFLSSNALLQGLGLAPESCLLLLDGSAPRLPLGAAEMRSIKEWRIDVHTRVKIGRGDRRRLALLLVLEHDRPR